MQKRLKSNLLRSKKYGQTAQKPKIGQKRPKLLKVSFSRSKKRKHFVMTKQLNESVHHKKRFLTELVQNDLNHSKLAAKQTKRPNCTKAENRSKTLKKAKTNENCSEMIFRTKYQNTFFRRKTNFFDQTALISVQTCCLKTINTANNTKTKNGLKTSKTVKAH